MPLSEEWREILESHWVRNDGGIFQCVFIPRCNMVGYLKTGYPWPWISLTATECFKQACFELTSTFTIYCIFTSFVRNPLFFFDIWDLPGPSPYQKSHVCVPKASCVIRIPAFNWLPWVPYPTSVDHHRCWT